MWERIRSDRGSTIILLAIVFSFLLAFGALSIDVGLLLVSRTQLQNAADAGALAGADWMASSSGDQPGAEQCAIRVAGANRAFARGPQILANQMSAVTVTEDDVTFPAARTIRVVAERSVSRGDPIRSFFGKVLDPDGDAYMDMSATATAGTFDECGASCVRPFCPPDRWYDANGNNKYDPDPKKNKAEYYDPLLTGYRSPADIGAQVVLKLRSANQTMLPQYHYPVDFPPVNKGDPVSGANRYRDWIQGCPDGSFVVEPNDYVRLEPGNMSGPTSQGIKELIATDPTAEWDAEKKEVVNSAYARSPRIVTIPLFSPVTGVKSMSGGKKVQVVKVCSFFIEGVSSGDVTGRFLRVSASGKAVPCAEQEGQSFLYKVRLTE